MPELLDPPRHLRLITSPAITLSAAASAESDQAKSANQLATRSRTEDLSRYRASAELGAEARSLYRLVAADALAHGDPLDRTALRVVLAVRQSRCVGPLTRFRSTDVWQLLFVDILSWCRARHLDVPSGCGAAVEYLIETLYDLDQLHPESDDLHELHRAIDECTGGWDRTTTNHKGQRKG